MAHEHDFAEPIISRGPLSDHGGMPFEMIVGWRCACGERSWHRGRRGDLFAPGAQLKAAARYLQDRYGLKITSAARPRRHEEEYLMSETTVAAPRNPYRLPEGRDTEWGTLVGTASPGRVPPLAPHDTVHGPGLSAADIDRMCRAHFQLGHSTRDREAQEELARLREELAAAYDEGYTAGRVERAQGLARDFRVRAMELHFRLQAAKAGPKAKLPEAYEGLRVAVGELMDFAEAIETQGDRAAAQVARDEGGWRRRGVRRRASVAGGSSSR